MWIEQWPCGIGSVEHVGYKQSKEDRPADMGLEQTLQVEVRAQVGKAEFVKFNAKS